MKKELTLDEALKLAMEGKRLKWAAWNRPNQSNIYMVYNHQSNTFMTMDIVNGQPKILRPNADVDFWRKHIKVPWYVAD